MTDDVKTYYLGGGSCTGECCQAEMEVAEPKHGEQGDYVLYDDYKVLKHRLDQAFIALYYFTMKTTLLDGNRDFSILETKDRDFIEQIIKDIFPCQHGLFDKNNLN